MARLTILTPFREIMSLTELLITIIITMLLFITNVVKIYKIGGFNLFSVRGYCVQKC